MSETEPRPRLRDDLVVSEQESDGQLYFILKDPITFRYFRMREPEYFLIRRFDGRTGFEQAARQFRDKFGLQVTAAAVAAFADKIESLYFFEGSRAEYETSSGRYKGQTKASLFSRLLFVKLKAFNPDRLLAAISPLVRFLFSPWAIIAMMICIFAGFFIYSANFSDFRFALIDLFTVKSLVVIFVSLAFIIFIHEFAHALTCVHFGGHVPEMGFLLLYFQLCFYSNLSDSWLFRRKSHRLAVMWAGLFFQMVIFALAVFGWRLTIIGTVVNDFFWLTANVSFIFLLFNVNPLIKLDGYYLLSEWVDLPNLRARAFAYMRGLTLRVLGLSAPAEATGSREKRIFVVYTLLAGIYSVLLIAYVLHLVYGLFVGHLGGFGFVLFLVLAAIIFKGPVVGLVKFLTRREVVRAMVLKPRNLIVGSVVVIALIVVLFFIPFPHQVGGNIIVRPAAEFTIIHQTAQGFLELSLRQSDTERSFSTEHIQLSTGDLAVLHLAPLAREGDLLKKGDTLAVIISNQVSTSLEAAQAELQQLQNRIALAKSPPKPEEIASAQAAVDAAQATVQQLNKDIERNQSLFEKRLIARQELEQSEAYLEVARSNLAEEVARLRLLQSPPKQEEIDILESQIASQRARISYLATQEAAQAITSPIDGRVVALYRDNLLFKIADMTRAEIAVPVTDNLLEYVLPDAKVSVKVRTYPASTFTGRVSQISGSAATTPQRDDRARFPVYALIDNPDWQLRDGMSGYAKIACGRMSLFTIMANRVKAYIRVEFWSWW